MVTGLQVWAHLRVHRWWASVEADRPCWYDDIMHFGADGTFVNAMGGETFVEAWQGGADVPYRWHLTMAYHGQL